MKPKALNMENMEEPNMVSDRDTSIFSNLFRGSPTFKVLEFFIEGRELDHAMQDVVDETGLSRSTLYSVWKNIQDIGLIKQTRCVGKTKLYKINLEDPVTRQVVNLYDEILKRELFPGHDAQEDDHRMFSYPSKPLLYDGSSKRTLPPDASTEGFAHSHWNLINAA